MKRRGMYSSSSFFKPFVAAPAPRFAEHGSMTMCRGRTHMQGTNACTLLDGNDSRKEDDELFVKDSN